MTRGASSPLAGVVLGLLIERPSYGYELAQRISERIGPAWRLTPSSIYPALDRMESSELIQRTVKDMPSRSRQRERVFYSATPNGHAAFEDWKARPVRREPIRLDLLARIAIASEDDASRLLAALDDYERSCIELLEEASGGERPPGRWEATVFELVESAAEQQLTADLAWIDMARHRLLEHAKGAKGG